MKQTPLDRALDRLKEAHNRRKRKRMRVFPKTAYTAMPKPILPYKDDSRHIWNDGDPVDPLNDSLD